MQPLIMIIVTLSIIAFWALVVFIMVSTTTRYHAESDYWRTFDSDHLDRRYDYHTGVQKHLYDSRISYLTRRAERNRARNLDRGVTR